MRAPLTPEDLDGLAERARTPKQQRAAAVQLTAWAEEVHPDDDHVFPASLLVCAGELLAAAGDHEAALQVFERAVGAEGHTHPDVRCYLLSGRIKAGDHDGARRLAEEVRRARLPDPEVYLFIGETYRSIDDLPEAHRWLTMGLTQMEKLVVQGDDPAGPSAAGLMMARYLVRRELDLPPDEYDDIVGVAFTGD